GAIADDQGYLARGGASRRARRRHLSGRRRDLLRRLAAQRRVGRNERRQPFLGETPRQDGFEIIQFVDRRAGRAAVGARGGHVVALLMKLAARNIGTYEVRVELDGFVEVLQRSVEVALDAIDIAATGQRAGK